ncbi:MAG: tetratricopeptide repeat protein [Formivibrio sp.]|nr:tetratricopeptide repeat protein [Formivibrio sp.]
MAIPTGIQDIWQCQHHGLDEVLRQCGVLGASLENISIVAGLLGISVFGLLSYLFSRSVLIPLMKFPIWIGLIRHHAVGIDNTPRANRFVHGRANELDQLHKMFRKHNAAAIVGNIATIRAQGGMGKTTLAEEYARQYRKEYAAIWFVSAVSPNSIAGAFSALGRRIGITRDKRIPIVEFATEVLNVALQHGKPWLIVFDNAPTPDKLRPFLESREGVHYIITSRYSDWTNVAQTIDVGVLPALDSLALLVQEAQYQDGGFYHLAVDVLGCFPLALVVAGGYLRQTRVSSNDYETALAQHLDDVPLNDKYENSVLRVVLQSCKDISPDAFSLLLLLAYFPPDAISAESILKTARATAESSFWDDAPKILRDILRNPIKLGEAFAELTRFSLLVEVQADPTMFEAGERVLAIHRLTQYVLRARMTNEERQFFGSLIVNIMRGMVPEKKGLQYETDLWSSYERIVPFALNLLNFDSYLDMGSAELAAKLCNSSAIYYRFVIGDLNSALSLIEGALRISKRAFGLEHKFTTTCMGNMADILGELGFDSDAESIFEKTIAIRQKSLGEFDAALAFTHNNYAEFLKKRGRYRDAVEHFGKAVTIREMNQLHGDRLTVISRSNLAETKALLASLEANKAALAAARADAEKALHDLGNETNVESVASSNTPAIALCAAQLASVLRLNGDVLGATAGQERAFRLYLKLYGPNHPDVWDASGRLAEYLEEAGEQSRAQAIRSGDFSNYQ